MCLGPDNDCAKYQLDRPSNTKIITGFFQILGVLVFQLLNVLFLDLCLHSHHLGVKVYQYIKFERGF